ncbi:MAG: glycerate kinase [Isosphaeraceae bacterium]|jgi:glycerate kinase|nr:MAG: glycerate kinase [Isosphaeraceae bacterium]
MLKGMRLLVAPDKFRGSLSAAAAAAAIASGVRRAVPAAQIDILPLADGGEGTVEALVAALGGRLQETTVTGPRGAPVRASWAVLDRQRTAVIEMAAASGLALLPPERRDPFLTTTRGTGELLRAALDAGLERVILGIGGSATNDGGTGMARALGYRFLDADGRELPEGGGALERLDRIDASGRDPRLDSVRIEVACDVDNPLTGVRGAAAVFGPQKFDPAEPPTREQIARLDAGLARLAEVIHRDLGVDVAGLPGAGAAGGLGAGLVAFAGGVLRPGFSIVAEAVGLVDRLEAVDLCLTGEGAIDASSVGGKTAVGVARAARAQGVPCLALCGTVGRGARSVLEEGVAAYFSLCNRPMTLDVARSDAAGLLAEVAEQAVRAFLAGRSGS